MQEEKKSFQNHFLILVYLMKIFAKVRNRISAQGNL